MKIFVTMKQAGKRRDYLTAEPFELPENPANLRELIAMLVKQQVAGYNAKQLETPVFRFFSEAELQNTAEQTGKIGFKTRYGEKKADEKQAVETALQAFEDGLFRVFAEDAELEKPNAPLVLQEGAKLTFIRLVMLAGRMW